MSISKSTNTNGIRKNVSVQHATACTRAWPRGKPRPMHMLRLHMYKPFVAPVHATDCTCPTPVVAMCMHLVAMYTTPPLDCTFTPRDPWVSLGWRHERSASQHAGAGLSMQLHGSGAGRHASGSHATPPGLPFSLSLSLSRSAISMDDTKFSFGNLSLYSFSSFS